MPGRPVSVLIVGTLPPPLGGAGVSLKLLVDALLQRQDISVRLVNTSGVRGNPLTGPFRFLAVVWRIFTHARRVEVVSLQAAPTGLPLIGPFVQAAARLWGKPLLVRKFGGIDYLDFKGWRGWLARRVVRGADLYLAQTKELVDSALRDGMRRVEWFPTSRPMDDAGADDATHQTCRRFVFLGLVRPMKGIPELIEAAERFGDDVSVDVYGPCMEGVTEQTFAELKRVHYRGVVPPGEGVRVLRNYDALVLPSYWPGEGYPGIIVEAYAAGLPVVTTRWRTIPEIVDDSCGRLVEPKDADALHRAMKELVDDNALYARLRKGAIAKRSFFDARTWTQKFVEHCRKLAGEFE